MEFTKMQACGNDYVYVDYACVKKFNLSALAKKISDRRFGIGSDGLIAVEKISDGEILMIMYNSDGTEGFICGNGVRCAAVFAREKFNFTASTVKVKTKSREVSVSMNDGYPVAEMGDVFMLFQGEFLSERFKKVGLYVDYKDIYCVNTGNIHLVAFTKEELGSVVDKTLKTQLFPDGVNIEKVCSVNADDPLNPLISAEIFERGSGRTLSCGSGAVAVAYSFNLRQYGKINEKVTVTVKTDGGELKVFFKNGSAFLQGEAVKVFGGVYEV